MSFMNIMIATPAFNGKVDIPYCLSLIDTINLLNQNNVQVTPLIVPSGSLLVAERNRILEAFWKSDCTHVLCIDSDLGWPSPAVLSMLQQKKDFIAGIYPARSNENSFIFRPVINENGSILQENHLLKMNFIPSGFILLTRNCIRKMRDKYPELYYKPKDKRDISEEAYALFNTEVYEGEFWGEDYVFCRRAREAGIDIWVDPLIQFNHAGKIGMLMECLTNNPNLQDQPIQQNIHIGNQ